MKKVLIATLLAGITMNTLAAEQIRFASSATYPPFEFLDANNQLAGFDIDLAKALCKQMKANCTFTNQAFDSLIAALKFKRYDAVISGMDITPERSKQVAFTQPYYANSAVVVAYKGKFNSLADLQGKKVGMENGTTHQKYLQDKYPDIKAVSYDSYQNALLELSNGRIEGVFGDTAAVNEWLKVHPQLTMVGEPVADAQYFGSGLGIAVRLDNKALLKKLNTALAAIKADGTYDAINNKWFPKQ
ncbi:arginine ABC transporter substrate-binding protein [Serratia microhaemolytica]|uniref:arginine ABC transporter substrate-binding protein n=1 Tax=Serratia microhaemolytica TaxID=2675110 RepID=UPI000FDD27F6|nr:arginine ABC transporter substrate-binding protein [Serratia microhaemolytica]